MDRRVLKPWRYRRNRIPRKLRYGPRVMDEKTGFMTYAGLLVQDELGYWTNPRFGAYQTRDFYGGWDT